MRSDELREIGLAWSIFVACLIIVIASIWTSDALIEHEMDERERQHQADQRMLRELHEEGDQPPTDLSDVSTVFR